MDYQLRYWSILNEIVTKYGFRNRKNASFLSLSLRAFTLNLVFALVSRKIPKDNKKGAGFSKLAYQDPIA
jgi:hypothetical protein